MDKDGVTSRLINLEAVSHNPIRHEWSSGDHVIAVWVCSMAIDRLWSIFIE